MNENTKPARTPRRWSTQTIVLAALLAVGLLAVGLLAVRAVQRSSRIAAAQITPPGVDGSTMGYRVGSSQDASVPLVVLYEDFQCVQCQQANSLYFATLTELASRGSIRFHVVEMTLWDSKLGNDASTRAAIAVGCAATVDAYLPYRQAVFATQPAPMREPWPDPDFSKTIALAAGLSGDQLASFQRCLANQATRDFVSRVNTLVADNAAIATEVARIAQLAPEDPELESEQLGPIITVNGKNPQVPVRNTTNLNTAWWKQLPPQQNAWMAAIQAAATS